jgi:hypothetical protein
MDLLNKYLRGGPPHFTQLTYDLDAREVVCVFVKKTDDSTSVTRLVFKDVLSFREVTFEDAYDDNLTDSVMDLHLSADGIHCLSTEKRELFLRVGVEPISETIALPE